MELTETESKVIGILIQHGKTADLYGAPIQDVNAAMGWTREETMKFVLDLENRNLIEGVMVGRDGGLYSASSYWKRPGA